ncbi:heme-binding protein [Serratia sp. M24T3]|uniref:GlcG/HbpS family heme-binding protein n=1 Tax=Serratia sp. M24T3 TaxID=932213 RepID=UPI00025BA52E|nr:heme-binding protein [Serratia sp. M24T3]EIC82687.1 hypothetical protein SPM24T3_20709 [Serratia sp. M24T3]
MKKILMLAALCSLGSLSAFSANATITQTILSAEDAAKLITVATEKAQSLHANVCIAIVDQAGQLMSFKRMDNAPVGCIDSSILKARAGALYHTPTDKYMGRANGAEPAIATLPGMVPLGGGNPIVYRDAVIGSVGVSGSANPNEIEIAKAAAESLK